MAAKRATVREREEHVAAARDWVNQAVSLLETLAVDDKSVAEQLNAASPADDSQLDASTEALGELLTAHAQRLAEDAEVDAVVAQGSEVATQLRQAPGVVETATQAKLADTAAIDRLDGLIYVAIRDLNRAGRRAIRAGKLQATLNEYRFQFTRRNSPPPRGTSPAGGTSPAV